MPQTIHPRTRRVVLDGMLFACAIVLSIIESMIPVPAPVPGVKLGLSNIVVMYALFFMSKRDAFIIAALKGAFAFITRGAIAGLLSAAGGFFSVAVMALLILISRGAASYFLLSVCGALAHNTGQMIVVSAMYQQIAVLAFIPVLAMSGVATGVVTSLILRTFLPVAKRLGLEINKQKEKRVTT